MLHVETSWITAMPPQLGDAITYLASEARPAVERQPGNLGTSLLVDLEAGALGFESFWASDGPLTAGEDVIVASAREAARRAGGTVTSERYEILVFELEAPLRGGQGARVTHMDVEPSKLSDVEDAVAWYGDVAVPQFSDASGFCAAMLYADWAPGRLISETVWRDSRALAASRSEAMAIEAAAARELRGAIGVSREYRLEFGSARPG